MNETHPAFTPGDIARLTTDRKDFPPPHLVQIQGVNFFNGEWYYTCTSLSLPPNHLYHTFTAPRYRLEEIATGDIPGLLAQ